MIQALFLLSLPFLTVISLQSILNRLLKRNPQILAAISILLGYPIFFLCVLYLNLENSPSSLAYTYLFLYYSLGTYTYFHFFNMSETSRRVRLALELRTASKKEIGMPSEVFDEEKMIRIRLDRLIALRQIEERDGLFFPRGKIFPLLAQSLNLLSCLLKRPWRLKE